MTEPKPRRHKWGDKVEFPLAHKSERGCLHRCGIVKVSRHESEGGRDQHWTEYWRGLDLLSVDKTPACEPLGQEATLGDQKVAEHPGRVGNLARVTGGGLQSARSAPPFDSRVDTGCEFVLQIMRGSGDPPQFGCSIRGRGAQLVLQRHCGIQHANHQRPPWVTSSHLPRRYHDATDLTRAA